MIEPVLKTPSPISPTPNKKQVVKRALILAAVSLGAGLLVAIVFSFAGPDREKGFWFILAATTGGLVFFPAVGFVLGLIIFSLLPRRMSIVPGIMIGSVILLALYSWWGWGMIFSADVNQNKKIESSIQSGTTVACAEVKTISPGRWTNCVDQTMDTAEDFEACLSQASDFAGGDRIHCIETYAKVKKDPSICDRSVNDIYRQFCREKVTSPSR